MEIILSFLSDPKYLVSVDIVNALFPPTKNTIDIILFRGIFHFKKKLFCWSCSCVIVLPCLGGYMGTNQKDDNDYDDDIEAIEDDLDPFLNVMENQDKKRGKANLSRQKIEALQEKQRLKKLLEDYPEIE